MTNDFLTVFISWLVVAAVVGASIVVVAYEEKEDERKKQARRRARRNAQERARRIEEMKRSRELMEAAFSRYEARRDFYKDIKTRRSVIDDYKTDEDGKLLWAKGHVA